MRSISHIILSAVLAANLTYGDDSASQALEPHIRQADMIVLGKITDKNDLNRDNINRYSGITVVPTEFLKGNTSCIPLRVSLLNFGRRTRVFPLMDEQVTSIETNLEAIFFLSCEGTFRDLDAGLMTMQQTLILPSSWRDRIRKEMSAQPAGGAYVSPAAGDPSAHP